MTSKTSFNIIEALNAYHPKIIDLSLGRIERLLNNLDNPHHTIPPVFHITGTNGKGSTLSFLKAMLEADGKAVHSFTSPHLVQFNERMSLAQEKGTAAYVSDEQLETALEICQEANQNQPITFFEMTTALAFWLFKKYQADFTLLEVGLGGRLDATNVIKKPVASIITPISMDHKEWLGDSLEKIAREKGGIIKEKCPLIIAPQETHVMQILQDIAHACDAPIFAYGEQWDAYQEKQRFIYQDEKGLLDLPLPALKGRHQLMNAGTAIAALRYTQKIDESSVQKGLENVCWQGRMQKMKGLKSLMTLPNAEIWLDGGHNKAGARAISETIADMEERRSKPLTLIIAMMARKDVSTFLKEFIGLAHEIICIPLEGHDKAHPPEALALEARSLGLNARTASSLKAALNEIKHANGEAPRILITGSLYLVGETLRLEKTLETS